MSVVKGAEPFHLEGGSTAVLLSHGFTGSPASIRPWGEYLHEQGYTVACPLLPGHGTKWQDLADVRWQDWYDVLLRTFEELAETHDQVFIGGLSMGGGLALRLAADLGDRVAGVMVVNPSVSRPERLDVPILLALNRVNLFGVVAAVMQSVPGIENDIKKPDQDEIAYGTISVKGALQYTQAQDSARENLHKVTQPLLVFWAPQDHVLEPANTQTVMRDVSSERRTLILLENSYHVATLDNDADKIFAESAAFIKQHDAAEQSLIAG